MTDHQPVLVKEALQGLAIVRDGWYVDGTYGRGGHSAEILAQLGEHGRLFALDKDPEAVADGRARFAAEPRFTIEHGGFEAIDRYTKPWLKGAVLAGVLLDLGVSSPQLDTAARGFSITRDGPLDMRMDSTRGATAAEWLERVKEDELREVLFRFGEEPRARQIAAAIVKARAAAPITTTYQLAELVAQSSGYRRSRIHPATRVFQAVRIQINAELAALERALERCVELLAAGGRLCAISFHSLEDRIVKRFIAREAKGDPAYAGLPDTPPHARPRLCRIGRLIRPSAAEVASNPRARGARLRVAERLRAPAT
ncbi:MAG: 16S rRNA (cytosine(1402)-N(4))-methyltransferase RsmH [Gammaproteobacteria bacterium]